MGKVAQKSAKYVIDAELDASGIVEKPDVVGAIFGQTEGLLGDELDLRELQECGRIGRIQVDVSREGGSSSATIRIPSSLDSTDTALIAASLETIERVGPTNADIKVGEIRDERVSKRDYIKKRAKQLLEDLNSQSPDHGKINEEVKKEVRTTEITEYEGFEAGPGAELSEEIVLVEGRADLLNLLRHGVKNAVAIGGTSVPDKLSELVDDREVTAFLDGDRGGDLILEELKEDGLVYHIARAPENKEVEELGKEEVHSRLRDREPVKFVEAEEVERDDEKITALQEKLEELVGTRAAHALDSELEIVSKIPAGKLHELEKNCHAILIDGEIDRDKIDRAEKLDADYIAGMEKSDMATSSEVELITRSEMAEVN